MLRNNLMLPTEALDIPEAIDFDGTNDYLSRASDLMGNADGKTFTFSAWVYPGDPLPGNSTHVLYSSDNSTFTTTGRFIISLTFSSGFATINTFGLVPGSQSSQVLNIGSTPGRLNGNTAQHILISCDMNDAGSKFRIYLNDVNQSLQYTVYGVSDIDFAGGMPQIGRGVSANPALFKGRLSNVFLDYTYRDLSVEANRRLFITADRKPAANQQALNPILYLPLNDPTQPGKNLGTGGDFNLTGVVARSGRGPNQFNAPYSNLDGSADYLSRTSALSGATNTTSMTFQFCVSLKSLSGTQAIFNVGVQNPSQLTWYWSNNNVKFELTGISGETDALVADVMTGSWKLNRNYIVTVSVDLSDAGKRHVFVNGESAPVTWLAYTNRVLKFNATPVYIGGGYIGFTNAKTGGMFIHNAYIDLSNPDNLAKFVTGTGIDAKPVDLGANGELPFGTPPLIYLPMYGNNAGKNYGTGGDFTVNSGPYTGARGPNEYWGNKADCGSSAGYLYKTGVVSGVYDGKTLSFSGYVNRASAETKMTLLQSKNDAATIIFEIAVSASGYIQISGYNSFGTRVLLGISSTTSLSAAVDYHICLSVDLSDVAKRAIYVNNILQTLTWTDYANDTMSLALNRNALAANWTGAAYASSFAGKLSEFYFTTTYIDFSQEANRLKFRDAFGNPVDLTPQIKAGTLPNPAIYMRFDPANFGKNSGTGGDFTVSGTITDGGQL